MEEVLADPSLPPANLRCRRNDGKQWQCKNWRLHGKSLCQEHFFYTGGLRPKKTATNRGSRRPKSTDTDLVPMQGERKRKKKGKRRRDDVEGETEGFTKNEDLPEKKKRGRKKKEEDLGEGDFANSSSGVASIRGFVRKQVTGEDGLLVPFLCQQM
ncbi:lysine-specific demethylase JMJ25-like protein isoform X1 [Cinnamomum micranthum f. kanehirae]|uniref:Lysine-specific demethylase JMJ25-like protein isoform X1 n=1 Tax=Cinnamomum micranthum f. kanehirae TaxID=337451 RepID=A0A3S3ND14_9MAGN|nr:lysine-specific demethylase JMJ25-like protein isoform X1 [Cinnamomum micranthum f. kanehirae]